MSQEKQPRAVDLEAVMTAVETASAMLNGIRKQLIRAGWDARHAEQAAIEVLRQGKRRGDQE